MVTARAASMNSLPKNRQPGHLAGGLKVHAVGVRCLRFSRMIRLISLAAIVFAIPCAAQPPEGLQKSPLSTFVVPLKRVV